MTEHAATRRREALRAAVLSGVMFLVVFDSLSVATALPSIGRGLDLGPARLQWVVNTYSLAIAGPLLLPRRVCSASSAACGGRCRSAASRTWSHCTG
ncbi:hypothetical protein SMC26_19080 [Actinomadura fulvescens]|uniref:hypothetical protein n=1 Tax=Actinomadura fulvescens TaxID=46160 RepID=UPI0031E1FC5E